MFSTYLKKIVVPTSKKSNSALNIPIFAHIEDERVGAEAYKNNSVVHRCVSLIATSASHIPWHVYKDCGEHKKLLSKHPAARLLKNPHPEKSGADFFTENISNLLLYGSSYILSSDDSSPSELYNLHPQMLKLDYQVFPKMCNFISIMS